MLTRHRITASARIPASAKTVYGIIADYRTGHPRILPPQFSGLTVEKGGYGAGTTIHFQFRVFGRTDTLRAHVTEPVPGRVLVESNVEGRPSVTTFTVTPSDDDQSCEVSILTEMDARSGWLGKIERALITRTLQPVYEAELSLLAKNATGTRALESFKDR